MSQVSCGVRRLRSAADTGQLSALAKRHRLELVTQFGSSLVDPDNARDIDLAFLPGFDAEPPDLVALIVDFCDLTGCAEVDLMDLERASPVALFAALAKGEVLFESGPNVFATQRLRAIGMFRDTAHFRELAVKVWAACP